jgi:YggT family protein
MSELLAVLAAVARGVRYVAAGGFAIMVVLMGADWAVRTRRLNPFGRIARVVRNRVEPRLRPIEGRLVRAGANPANAPLLMLLVVAVAALLLIFITDSLVAVVAQAVFAGTAGPRAVLVLLVSWTFGLLRVALLVRVVSSWIQMGRHSRWVRWAYVLTDPIIQPLQRLIPTLGMIDITPIVAYFGLVLLERLLVPVPFG